MIIETKLDFKQYLKLTYTLAYRQSAMIIITIAGLLMFIASIIYFLGGNTPTDYSPYVQLALGLFFIVYLPYSIYRNTRRNFNSNARMQEKMTYEFTEDKIRITGETFNSEWDWTKTYKIIELKDWVLIYQNRYVASLIPKASLGDKIFEFRDLIRSKNIKAKLKNN